LFKNRNLKRKIEQRAGNHQFADGNPWHGLLTVTMLPGRENTTYILRESSI
jgi:hypothetical protein